MSSFYPPDGLIASLIWTAKRGLSYVSYALGGTFAALVAVSLLGIETLRLVARGPRALMDSPLLLILMVLVGGSLAAAFLGLYPFGGIRQQLFAAPLIIVCTIQAAMRLSERLTGIWPTLIPWGLVGLIAVASLPQIPSAYGEKEDIVSAVSEGLADVPDENTYVYYGALPAVKFHYPDRRFRRGIYGRGQVERMGMDIVRNMHGCRIQVLFAHMYNKEDDLIISFLEERGVSMGKDLTYNGARVVKFSLCEHGS